MADANRNTPPFQAEHILTVKQTSRENLPWGAKLPSLHPWLRLAGRWLVVDAGFAPHQRVRVQVEFEKITITPFD
ncbi:SymE family type I addiction module toxin [Paraburkholderia bonniea]|uniref:SymE family type I addiction module toxin n=1 Tax=Paraburkholderia bonniea TaxID=2152891 RepID=UPI00129091FA|nr:SymE family type I addiction module toxin [Paraburkholderia bonniea]WJF90296.1 SymE family type I addiction module toxin [Paraburkholderia bonniea]WJF93611.1 SymE family type I addiction module toxin [Paraburkholderia bonniea]